MARLFAAPAVSSLRVSTFKGLDVSMPDDQIALYRAADSLNMIPDASGEVRKRPGIQYEKVLWGAGISSKVLEMHPGYLCVSLNMYIDPGGYRYTVLFPGDGDYIWSAVFESKPTVIKCGDKVIVFATRGTLYGVEGADFDAAVMVCAGDKAYAYTDGGKKWEYGGVWSQKEWEPDDEYIKTPISMIGCAPEGGGTPHEQINLLSPWVTESFCVTKEDGAHTFSLNGEAYYDDVGGSATCFKVRVLAPEETTEQIDGTDYKSNQLKWFDRYPENANTNDAYKSETNSFYLHKGGKNTEGHLDGNAFIYNLEEGGNIQPTPIEGADNVQITYKRKDFSEGFETICHCMCGGVYGVGGYKDRLFVGGSDLGDSKNIVYYSEMDQPLYFGALNYIRSEQGSEVLALNGTGKSLAILTDCGIALVTGQASEGNEDSFVTDSIYTISATIPAPRPIGYNNTAIFGGEIVYLSEDGIIAIAAKDNYDERYAEHRSALINRKMLADQPQKLLSCGRYLLVFCVDGYCWLLDENQPSSAGDRPYSSHQYEGFRMSGFECDCAFVEGDTLKLTKRFDVSENYSGLYRWMKGDEQEDYSDERIVDITFILNGLHDVSEEHISEFKSIPAFWETPWIYGSNFYRKKRFSRLALLLGEANLGDYQFKVEGKKNDETEWSTIWDYDGTFCTFNYGRVNYGLFTYRTTHACPDIVRKIKIKKALRFKLRFSNDKINQSFVLREFGLDYVLGG